MQAENGITIPGINIPPDAAYILKTLKNAGFKAYIVGGCVRDSIVGRTPGDWDITTDAQPTDVKRLFDKTVDTGIRHGTVTVVVNGRNFEVTTFRVDGEYRDGRHPASIGFASSVNEDLGRRDFTVNSIAYNHEEGFIDPYDGIGDIRRKLIRTVGDPGQRFSEDALRMLRAVRFSAMLDFDIDERTMASIKENSSLITKISRERIRDELTKTLVSEHPEKFSLLHDCGLLEFIMPELEACYHTRQNHPYHIYSVAEHTLAAVSFIEADSLLRWTMLLHDIGKPLTMSTDENGIDHFYGHAGESVRLAEEILKRLKFDNKFIDRVCRLVKHHDRKIEPDERHVRKTVSVIGDDIFYALLKVQEADKKAQNPVYLDERLDVLRKVCRIYSEIKAKAQCTSLKDLAVNGRDLMDIGFKTGPEVGKMLKKLLDVVLEDPDMNTRPKLIEIAQNELKWMKK